MTKIILVSSNNTCVGTKISPFLLGILVVFVFASCKLFVPSPVPILVPTPMPTAMVAVDRANVLGGALVTLNASASSSATVGSSITYSWEQTSGPNVELNVSDPAMPTFTAPSVTTRRDLVFELTVTDSNGETAGATVTVTVSPVVDGDADGLIEISTLEGLHNMRYNLAGTSYKTSAAATGSTGGCPESGCKGYELTQNLDFDADGDGSTWTGNSEDGFSLDPGDDNDTYFDIAPDGTGGWVPIGNGSVTFTATFEGNGYTISNLAIRRGLFYVGFFGYISGSAVIQNIGLIDNLADYSGSGFIYIGGLVARQDNSRIIASYTTGPVDGSPSGIDDIGGLVGFQSNGRIIASYTTGNVNSGNGDTDQVGGLVGRQSGASSIVASYATGEVSGGNGTNDRVGGLVGEQSARSSIVASYATGGVNGGSGGGDFVGGMVGWQASGGRIIASYAIGDADGGGAADGEADDTVGRLVGGVFATEGISTSYGFGALHDGTSRSGDVLPVDITASNLVATAMSAGVEWDAAASDTSGAWDFGTAEQAPVLQYADYDGMDENDYSCDMFLESLCGSTIPGQYPGGR